MKNTLIDIDCRMNLVIEEQNGKLVVKDATILSDIELETIIPGDASSVPRLIAESKLNTFPVFPLSADGYFIIHGDADSFSEWVKQHVSEIRSGIE